ncbi:hypothetical protein LINGRAHAP2_LOCUS19236 [Linum grandiflorum]
MHDLVHDSIKMLSKEDCVSIRSEDMVREVSVSSPVRNLAIAYDLPWHLNSSHFFLMTDLRHFMTITLDDIDPMARDNLLDIRFLVLSDNHLKNILSTINQFIDMRHLDISNSQYLEELPDEICELYNLCALIINFCRQLRGCLLECGLN